MSGVRLGGRESDLTIPECGLAIMHHGLFACVPISITPDPLVSMALDQHAHRHVYDLLNAF